MAVVTTAVVAGAISLGEKLLDIGDQFIEDKDKKAEYAFEVAKMTNAFSSEVLSTSTVPWVDATVKILYAMRDVVIPMLRPIGAAAMSGFAAYASVKGIEMNDVVTATMAGAFPAWGTSRHLNKNNEQKEQTRRHTVTERRKALDVEGFDFNEYQNG